LNNDTVAPPETCSKLLAKALEQPRAGIVGSVLYFLHRPSEVQAWGGGNLTVWLGYNTDFHAPAPLGPNSFLTFASVLIPREVIEKVGLLYEGYFMYWEDADYALRVTRAGYSLTLAEDTAILHKEGGSAEPRSPVIDRYSLASGLTFLRRHAALPSVSMALFLTTRLAGRLLRREWKNVKALFLAIGDYRRQRGKVYSETL
jgi:GT2 family glycosyltransferase